ncbi:MAG: DUF1736 domain-containing protein [Acidobacteria bacterium]|nr:DUF1736 domain-containing protein [Acidobacteriota bacterium]
MTSRKRHILLIAALWGAALAAYSNSFQGALVFDAQGLILEDARLAAPTAANVKRIFTEDYWSTGTRSGLYRPLVKLTYMATGTSPALNHWVNFLLHAINLTLVYLLGLVLMRRSDLAFLWAAVWALHPVLTESVTNVVGRPDLLAGFAVLAGLLCHIRRQRAALAVVALIGVFSKESAVVLLAAMVLYDIAWRNRDPVSYACVAAPLALFAWARMHVFHGLSPASIPFTDNPIVAAGFVSGLLTAIKVIGRYLLLLLWPSTLSCDYSYNEVPLAGWDDFGALASLAVIAAAAVWTLRNRRRRPLAFLLVGLFFAGLLPTANLLFPIGTIMAERFLYVPAIGFAGCAVLAAGEKWGRWVLAAACVLLAVRTWARNEDWRDNQSLWASAAAAAPDSYKAHMSAAGGLPLAGAAREMDRALAIVDPLPDARNVATVYVNAGGLFRDMGDAARPPEREKLYRKSLATLERGERIQNASGSVRWFQLYQELGAVWLRLGDFDRAAVYLFEATMVAPGNPQLKAELADAYGRSGVACAVRNGAVNMDCPPVREQACRAARNLGNESACEPPK